MYPILVSPLSSSSHQSFPSHSEGRTLSKLYKIPFVEISALMSVNTDLLWESIVRLLSPRPQTTSFLGKTPFTSHIFNDSSGRVIASCEQMVRNALSFSPTPNRSIDGDSHEDSRGILYLPLHSHSINIFRQSINVIERAIS